MTGRRRNPLQLHCCRAPPSCSSSVQSPRVIAALLLGRSWERAISYHVEREGGGAHALATVWALDSEVRSSIMIIMMPVIIEWHPLLRCNSSC